MNRTVILIVEDEVLIRLSAVEMAEEAGYEVLEAATADEAISVLERHPEVRIVFTDVNMPGSMDGLKLVQAIRDRWPPVLLVVTSGQCAVRESDLPAGGRFIPKPYNSRQLASVFQAVQL